MRVLVPLAVLSTALIGGGSVASGSVDPWNQASGPTLAAVIAFSRDQAMSSGTKPIPPAVRRELAGHFPDHILGQVRWTVAGQGMGIDTLVSGVRDDEHAITLGRVIVFSDVSLATDTRMWVHELLHVGQYNELGIARFAEAYAEDWHAVEEKTRERTRNIMRRLGREAPKGAAT